MEIFLGKRTIRQLRLSISDAIDDGDTETLREDLIEAFSEDEVEEIERRVDSGDIYEFISDILEEWGAEDVDELFEILEGQLNEADVELKYASPSEEDGDDDEDDEDEDEDELPDGELDFDPDD